MPKYRQTHTHTHTHTHSYIILNAFPWAGVTTRYELDDPGIESRWGKDYHHPSKPALGPTYPPVQWIPSLFSGGKAARARPQPPTLSKGEVKERVLPLWAFMSHSRVEISFMSRRGTSNDTSSVADNGTGKIHIVFQ